MNPQVLKEKACYSIDEHQTEIIGMGRDVFASPEMGYKELKTATIVRNVFARHQTEYRDQMAITGVRADIPGRTTNVKVAILGELDAVLCPMHPMADKVTGAAHACGHNAQIATMLGAFIGLHESGVMNHLDGSVAFMAVPAEEYVELEYRQRLRQEGKIGFLGGKQELVRIGAFDDIDMAIMVHCQAAEPRPKVYMGGESMGFIGKTVRFLGREAHAGGAPHDGVNALNAAMAALMCIHAQRETFRDEDSIRVHPIITKGGDLVNIVPADVRMETYVRGKTMEAIFDASFKVNRAIEGGAYAIGADVEISEIPGYMPLQQDAVLGRLFTDNIRHYVGDDNIVYGEGMPGSTDMGDLSCLMPVIHPRFGGCSGPAHSQEFKITDEVSAYIIPAKAMAMTVIDLLWNGAAQASKIMEGFTPTYTKQAYLDMLGRLERYDMKDWRQSSCGRKNPSTECWQPHHQP